MRHNLLWLSRKNSCNLLQESIRSGGQTRHGCTDRHRSASCALRLPRRPHNNERTRHDMYPKLLHAVVDAALVLVDVRPGIPGGTKRRHVALGRLGDAVETRKEHFNQLPMPNHHLRQCALPVLHAHHPAQQMTRPGVRSPQGPYWSFSRQQRHPPDSPASLEVGYHPSHLQHTRPIGSRLHVRARALVRAQSAQAASEESPPRCRWWDAKARNGVSRQPHARRQSNQLPS